MTEFGDIETADAYDGTARPAPEQIAYRLHRLRTEVAVLAGNPGAVRFDELTPAEQNAAFGIGFEVVAWLSGRRRWSPGALAQWVHGVARLQDSTVRPWDDLSPDEQQIGVDLADLILQWLRREGSIR